MQAASSLRVTLSGTCAVGNPFFEEANHDIEPLSGSSRGRFAFEALHVRMGESTKEAFGADVVNRTSGSICCWFFEAASQRPLFPLEARSAWLLGPPSMQLDIWPQELNPSKSYTGCQSDRRAPAVCMAISHTGNWVVQSQSLALMLHGSGFPFGSDVHRIADLDNRDPTAQANAGFLASCLYQWLPNLLLVSIGRGFLLPCTNLRVPSLKNT